MTQSSRSSIWWATSTNRASVLSIRPRLPSPLNKDSQQRPSRAKPTSTAGGQAPIPAIGNPTDLAPWSPRAPGACWAARVCCSTEAWLTSMALAVTERLEASVSCIAKVMSSGRQTLNPRACSRPGGWRRHSSTRTPPGFRPAGPRWRPLTRSHKRRRPGPRWPAPAGRKPAGT